LELHETERSDDDERHREHQEHPLCHELLLHG
jgi:hypothetical protein